MNTNRVDFVFLTLKAASLVFVRSAQNQRPTIEPLIHNTLHVPRLFIYSVFWWSEVLCVPFYIFCIVKIPKTSSRNATKVCRFCFLWKWRIKWHVTEHCPSVPSQCSDKRVVLKAVIHASLAWTKSFPSLFSVMNGFWFQNKSRHHLTLPFPFTIKTRSIIGWPVSQGVSLPTVNQYI